MTNLLYQLSCFDWLVRSGAKHWAVMRELSQKSNPVIRSIAHSLSILDNTEYLDSLHFDLGKCNCLFPSSLQAPQISHEKSKKYQIMPIVAFLTLYLKVSSFQTDVLCHSGSTLLQI
jgi:hypothetical protein